MKHQYGKKYYGYDDIPEIFKDGAEAGIDALMMFGWTKYGHDNLYPLYDADESQGGEEKLKEKIAEFKNAGGRVILYFNGRLIDVGSDYYKNIGKKICIKDENGYETLEQYPFAGNGSASRWFGCKTFVSACPTSEEWFGILESCVEKADALGVDSIFFDQMGICEKICHDPSHSHGSPCNDPGLRKAGLLKRLRQKAVNSNSKMALGIEALSDVTAQHADYIHNLTGGCSFSGNKIFGFLDLFRYVLPEVIVSDRDIRDDSDIERRVNHAAMKGLRSDVEIYRCRKTIKETPHYKEYLSRINALRSKYSDVLLEGAYCDAEGFYLSDRNVAARRFEGKTRDAIVVTQSAEDSIVFELDYDCGEYLFCDGIGIIEALEAGEKTLKLQLSKNALAVLIFGKK
jgi:hypothetical protein